MNTIYIPIQDFKGDSLARLIVLRFHLSIRGCHEAIFNNYKGSLVLTCPKYTPLKEDCDIQDLKPRIMNSMSGITDIVDKLNKIRINSPFPKKNFPNFENREKTQDLFFDIFYSLFDEYKKSNPQAENFEFYHRLMGIFSLSDNAQKCVDISKSIYVGGPVNAIRPPSIHNSLIGITNLLYFISYQFPDKKPKYYYYLSAIYDHARQAGFDFFFDGMLCKSNIQISYRDEGRGKGPFYDHYTIQCITHRNTEAAISQKIIYFDLMSEVMQFAGSLYYGGDYYGKKLPLMNYGRHEDQGLLIIPGRARDTEKKRKAAYGVREEHESRLIKEALLTGRPMLGICAGSWQIWQKASSLGGALIDVKGHNYRGGMPRILNDGTIGYNKQVHDIRIFSETLLAKSMGILKNFIEEPYSVIPVNSVHWKSVDNDPHSYPFLFNVSAVSQKDKEFNQPETAEAFESIYGAPILGIQWHPEAYNHSVNNYHHNLIVYLVKAGDTYSQKQKLLQEIKLGLYPKSVQNRNLSRVSHCCSSSSSYGTASPDPRYNAPFTPQPPSSSSSSSSIYGTVTPDPRYNAPFTPQSSSASSSSSPAYGTASPDPRYNAPFTPQPSSSPAYGAAPPDPRYNVPFTSQPSSSSSYGAAPPASSYYAPPTLESIPGIGEIRRKNLLGHFGGIQQVNQATVKELAEAPGIGQTLAKHIYDHLH